jgi:signal transduction histidine kinase
MTPGGRGWPYGVSVRKSLHLLRPSGDDVLVVLAFVALGQAVTWLRLDSADAFAGSRVINAAFAAFAVSPLLWRRSAPVVALCGGFLFLCVPHLIADLDVTVLGTFLPLIVLTASVGYYADRRMAFLGAAIACAGLVLVSWSTPFLGTPASLGFNTFLLLAPWAAARGLREREERARRLGATLAQERAERETRMQEVIAQERARIARELHDVVAHGVSVMVVQVGGARLQLSDRPDRARRSLVLAEDAGRQALSDLRQLLGVLRTSSAELRPADARPLPGLGQLPALLDQLHSAGLEVELVLAGAPVPLPPMLDLSAYRIVQEALTNTIKHSGASRAQLTITYGAAELRLEITDDGAGRPPDGEGGHGIVGMRERAGLFRGNARIGPRQEGGWAVEVTLPLESSGTGTMAVVSVPGEVR